MNKSIFASILAAAVLVSAPIAHAQTAIVRQPPNRSAADNTKSRIDGANQAAAQAALGLDAIAEEQARLQASGDFGVMQRNVSIGGQIQSAWSYKTKGQGVHIEELCDTCVYKVRLREYMTTAIVLPERMEIESVDLGDTNRFDAKRRTKNILVVKPLGSGVDSSMKVYTKEGQVLSFYLRSESVRSKHAPDLTFKIEDRIDTSGLQVINFVDGANGTASPSVQGQMAATGAKDFLKTATFDPSKIRDFDSYKLWGDKSLKPEQVYRDDNFTYIQYGDKWNDIELPTAYVVVDDIDELVNTRVIGTTFVVESTHRLITLKSGQSYMCIQYLGD